MNFTQIVIWEIGQAEKYQDKENKKRRSESFESSFHVKSLFLSATPVPPETLRDLSFIIIGK